MPADTLRLFVMISESGSLSRAAQLARTTPSTVSRRIAALEDELGVSLISRTTRRLALTEAGEKLLARCGPLISEFDAIRIELRETQSEPSGHLRVSASTGFGGRYLVPLLGEFRRTYPAIWVDVRLEDKQADLVANEADIAIRVGRLPDSSLRSCALGSLQRIACASPSYFLNRPPPKDPADLADHECIIVGSAGRNGGAWRFRGGSTLRLEPRLIVSSHEAAGAAAVTGAGIAHLPWWLVDEDLKTGRLERVLERYEQPSSGGVYLVWRDRAPAKVRAFVSFLRERIGLRDADA